MTGTKASSLEPDAAIEGFGAALADACYCLSVRKVSRKLIRFYDRRLEPHGLTIGQFGILVLITQARDLTVQALADALEMDQSAVSRALAPLERDGLVASRSDMDDRRRRIVTLTDAGRARLGEAAGAWKSAQDDVTARAGALDLGRLIAALDDVSTPR